MRHTLLCCIALLLAAGPARGEDAAVPAAASGAALKNEATKADETKSEPGEAQKKKEKSGDPKKVAKGEKGPSGDQLLSGMSIVGNDEAPKSLVIVPWKSSEIGKGIGLSSSMNDRPVPVDKQVFGRQVRYYEIRSGVTGE